MVSTSIQTSVGILLMLAVGYVLGAKNAISDKTKQDMNKLVVKLFMPCSVLSGFQNQVNLSMIEQMTLLAAAVALSIIALVVFSYGVSRAIRVKKGNRGVFICLSSFPNAAFIGLPVVGALFGDEGLPYAIIMIMVGYVVINPLCYHFTKMDAALIKGGDSVKIGVKEFFKSLVDPAIFAAVLAVVLLFVDFKLPEFVLLPVDLLAELTSPVSLLVAGYVIAKCDKTKLKPDKEAIVSLIIRLGVSGVAIYGFTVLFGITGFVQDVAMVQFTLPCMVLVITLSDLYGANSTLSAKGFFYTVIGSVATMPLYAALFA